MFPFLAKKKPLPPLGHRHHPPVVTAPSQPAVEHFILRDGNLSVSELAPLLLSTYKIERGCCSLQGCAFTEVPFFYAPALPENQKVEVRSNRFFDRDGQELGSRLVERMGLSGELNEAELPRSIRPVDVTNLIAHASLWMARRELHQESTKIVWCRWVEGKIAIVVGSEEFSLPFQGWANELRNGLVRPQPFVCSKTGIASYNIAVADDGRVTVAEALDTCAITGLRTFRDELETCSETGLRVVATELLESEVSDRKSIRLAISKCPSCGCTISESDQSSHGCIGCSPSQVQLASGDLLKRIYDYLPNEGKRLTWTFTQRGSLVIAKGTSLLKSRILVWQGAEGRLVRARTKWFWQGNWREQVI